MTAKPSAKSSIPVVDVDQAFPTMVETPAGSASSSTLVDQGPTVRTAIRNVLGVRSRREDPKAFVDALTASFRLSKVEGHIESEYVPRGYAIQADLGAVSGGQASLYRRATIARAEILRILDALTPLRTEGDPDDMEAYRVIVRNSVQSLVDEMGLPGGPRLAMVDSYFAALVGRGSSLSPDQVTGQLGALRDRFGLTDDNVNTIEEEGRRTAFWTLVDLIRDLRNAWRNQRKRFSGTEGNGFLGTELIHISRLMEAATDQVEELERVLDSVLIGANERQTITLDSDTNLTLDGLLTWLTTFLHDEGRRLAQEAGRDGIVSALTPTAVALATTFKRTLARLVLEDDDELVTDDKCCPVRFLPASCCQDLPPGMKAARVKIAVASLCRLLLELARRALGIGRYAGVVLIDITMSTVADGGNEGLVNVEFRGLNMRDNYEPAFVPAKVRERDEDCRVEDIKVKKLVRPIPGTVTADGESISALFRTDKLKPILEEVKLGFIPPEGLIFEAADFPSAVIDTETARVIHAPPTTTWPDLVRADRPRTPHDWTNVDGRAADSGSTQTLPTKPDQADGSHEIGAGVTALLRQAVDDQAKATERIEDLTETQERIEGELAGLDAYLEKLREKRKTMDRGSNEAKENSAATKKSQETKGRRRTQLAEAKAELRAAEEAKQRADRWVNELQELADAAAQAANSAAKDTGATEEGD